MTKIEFFTEVKKEFGDYKRLCFLQYTDFHAINTIWNHSKLQPCSDYQWFMTELFFEINKSRVKKVKSG